MSPKWPDGRPMSALDCLDNLHRCALCYRSQDPEGWRRHCREMGDAVEEELRAFEPIKKHAIMVHREINEKADKITIRLTEGMSQADFVRFARTIAGVKRK